MNNVPKELKFEIEHELMINHGGARYGIRIKFLCVCHDDGNPSASYNTKEHVWHCFSCGASGHVLGREGLAVLLGFEQPDTYKEFTAEKRQGYAKRKTAKQKEIAARQKGHEVKEAEVSAKRQQRFEEANTQYKSAKEGLVSQYCEYKGVSTFRGVHCIGSETLLPMINVDSKIIAYQKIYRKRTHEVRFVKIICGPSKGGLFFIQDKELKTDLPEVLEGIVYFCEGFSTGCSIHLAINCPVVCAVSAQSMLARVKEFLERYPDIEGIVCADNDASKTPNTGLKVGKTVAYEYKLKMCFPKLGQDVKADFNDLHVARGLEAVKETIMNSKRVISNPNRLKPSDKNYKTYKQVCYAKERGWK